MASRVVPNLAKVASRKLRVHGYDSNFACTLQIYNRVDVYPLIACIGVAVSFCVYKGSEHLLVRRALLTPDSDSKLEIHRFPRRGAGKPRR